jgi:hypothetical protein
LLLKKLIAFPENGARNIRTLSARFIADMQEHWEKHGMSALDEVRPEVPRSVCRQLRHAGTHYSDHSLLISGCDLDLLAGWRDHCSPRVRPAD